DFVVNVFGFIDLLPGDFAFAVRNLNFGCKVHAASLTSVKYLSINITFLPQNAIEKWLKTAILSHFLKFFY
ncbi:MAG: hypothetical protein IKD66_01780, partial [Solobacterium sp.]|nr:hypothetical protein [Solobacterium sp.]